MLDLLNELENSVKNLIQRYQETKDENEKLELRQKEADDLITMSTEKINYLKDEIAKLELEINKATENRNGDNQDGTIIHSSY